MNTDDYLSKLYTDARREKLKEELAETPAAKREARNKRFKILKRFKALSKLTSRSLENAALFTEHTN